MILSLSLSPVDEEEDVLISYYRSCCEQLGLVPVDYFLRHMRNTNIRMRYRGLGSDATRAIALSLKVREVEMRCSCKYIVIVNHVQNTTFINNMVYYNQGL